MRQVAVPVERVGMPAAHLGIDGIARQPVLPERRLQRRLEMRLVPDIAAQPPPVRMPRLEVGLIDRESHRIHLRNKLRLARHGTHRRVYRFAYAHVIIPPHRIPVRLEIHLIRNVEVHAAPHILHHEAVAAGYRLLEIYIPNIGARQVLAARLGRSGRLRLPVLDGPDLLRIAGSHVVEIYILALE